MTMMLIMVVFVILMMIGMLEDSDDFSFDTSILDKVLMN